MSIEISLKSFLSNIIGIKEDIQITANVSIANVILIYNMKRTDGLSII